MKAILYQNNSDERYVDKSLVVLHDNVDVIFKDDSDMVHPTIRLNHTLTGNVNYVWLEDLGRYYFVRSKELLAGMLELSLEVDVLSTYKRELRGQYCIVSRQEYNYNLFQNDDNWKLYSYTAKRTIPFPSGFNMGTQEFVLGISGGEGSGS